MSATGTVKRSRLRRSALALALVAASALASAVAGCGNYSNEDLEFMSALPERDDVTIEVPRQTSSLTNASAAAGWQMTVDITRKFNAVADAFLALIDGIRSSYPTSRAANTRTWGPFPDQKNPGWQIEFRMAKRIAVDGTAHFDYEIVMMPPAGAPPLLFGGPETRIIVGTFAASGGARLGAGRMILTLDEARAAGVVFTDLDKLSTLSIDYQTRDWPRHVTMTIQNLPSPDPADLPSATYDYDRAQNGDGAMRFSFPGDAVPGPVGSETLVIESRWLGAGQGRQDVSVTGGDIGTAVATSTECWDERFQSTFKLQSWDPTAGVGDPARCISRL